MPREWSSYRLGEYGVVTWDTVNEFCKIRIAESDIAIIRFAEQGLAVPEEWVAYRQALQEITTTFSSPDDVVFPDPPESFPEGGETSQEDRLQATELMLSMLLDQEVGK